MSASGTRYGQTARLLLWVLAGLLFIDLILLFFVSMTSVFLLRVFFADRRKGRGRTTGVARPATRVITTNASADAPVDEEETDGSRSE